MDAMEDDWDRIHRVNAKGVFFCLQAVARAQAENAATRCGLQLPDQILEELVAVAPWALAMSRRLKRDHPREAETASIFDPRRDVD